MDPDNPEGWTTLRRSLHKTATQKSEASMEGNDMKPGQVPSAYVHPFKAGEGDPTQRETESVLPVSSLHHRQQQFSASNLPSPYLLSARPLSPTPHQLGPPTTPPTGGHMRSPPSITVSHTLHYPTTEPVTNMELLSLRSQVQEIQNRLDFNVTKTPEYQQLLSEKCYLYDTLGSTEYSLEQLKIAYKDLKESSSAMEQEHSLKVSKAESHMKQLHEEREEALFNVKQLREYLRDLPTPAEHEKVQDQLERRSEDITRLNNKVHHLTQTLQMLQEQENERTGEIKALTQERDDMAVKLSLTENILKEVESQRETAREVGEHTMEDLLWTLQQTKKELNSAKQLLQYRKEKLESLHEELLVQDKRHCGLLQVESEEREALEEKYRELQRSLQQLQQQHQQVIAKLTSTEEKQKRAEERLELAVGEVASQRKAASVVSALLANIRTAVSQLKDLVTISRQISEGQTPDITVLLNLPDGPESGDGGNLCMETLTEQLKEVKTLVLRLEAVRSHLQEQYAHQLAKDVSCAQM